MYDPTLGRFIERDPIGYYAGESNLYAYVGNRSIQQMDPSGLRSFVTQVGSSAKDCKIIIKTIIDFHGEAATKDNVEKIVKDIESHWNKGFRYFCCEVQLKVDARIEANTDDFAALLAQKDRKGNADRIELKKGGPNANVYDLTSGGTVERNHVGIWYAQTKEEKDNFRWTPAHEYGHLLGLEDRYGERGKPGRGKAHPGWDRNIMGAPDQPVEQRNVTEVLDSVVKDRLANLVDYCCRKPKGYGKTGLWLRGKGLIEFE